MSVATLRCVRSTNTLCRNAANDIVVFAFLTDRMRCFLAGIGRHRLHRLAFA